MEHDYRRLARQVFGSQFVFALVMLSAVLPMMPLQDRADPLGASHWYASTGIHSAGIAFVLALIYAAITYFWLRANPAIRPLVWFVSGAVVGLVPGFFYAVLRPDLAASIPITVVLLGGVASGVLLGGPAYLLLRYFRFRDHVA